MKVQNITSAFSELIPTLSHGFSVEKIGDLIQGTSAKNSLLDNTNKY